MRALILLLTAILPLCAGSLQEKLGVKILSGARYDDVRMCVASPAGEKGGFIAEVYLQYRKPLAENRTLLLELPVFRPIVFAAKFQMMQFEPQATLEFKRETSSEQSLRIAPGLGFSAHYGPGYRSDEDNREPDFWAFGPIFSTAFSLGFDKGRDKALGIKLFCVPLFSSEELYKSGITLGGAIEYQFSLAK